MKPDDQICCCYHVSLRKLMNFARREKPRVASQLSECLNAGTGCGWCIPILKKIHEEITAEADAEARADQHLIAELPDTPEAYAEARSAYLKSSRKNRF